MKQQRIFVTGAAGFIGSHIVDALVERGHAVMCMDDLSGGDWRNIQHSRDLNPHTEPVMQADCADRKFLNTVLSDDALRPDTLVHCAANAREGASQFQPHSVCHKNLHAYSAVLSAAIANGVKNVVLFSSMAVYGKQAPPFDERTGMQPVDVYGLNKSAMEQMTHILASVHGFNYVIIRPHNVFGERQRMADKFRNVVAIFMNRIMRNEPLFIYGDGEQQRAFSYIGDSLPCFLTAIEECATLGNPTVNVGGMEYVTINELASVVKEAMGVGQDYPADHYDPRPLEVKLAYSTYELSQRLLHYTDNTGWREGVKRMAEWAKAQGPQDWVNNEPLEIVSALTPKPWLQ